MKELEKISNGRIEILKKLKENNYDIKKIMEQLELNESEIEDL